MGKKRKFQGMGMLSFYERKKRDVRIRRNSLTKQNTQWGRNCRATAGLSFFTKLNAEWQLKKMEKTTQNNRNSFSRNP